MAQKRMSDKDRRTLEDVAFTLNLLPDQLMALYHVYDHETLWRVVKKVKEEMGDTYFRD